MRRDVATAVAMAGFAGARRTMAGVARMTAIVLPAVAMAVAPSAPGTARADDADPPAPVTVRLSLNPTVLDMDRLRASRMGYMPATLEAVATKPVGILKEPAYAGTPRYGVLRVGNGPRCDTRVVIDVLKAGSRLYVDGNNNGDLSDDGTGEWDVVKEINGAKVEFATRAVRASWGTPTEEKETGDYRLHIFRRPESKGFSYAKVSGREGRVRLGTTATREGREYAIVLAESTNDALFTVPARGDLTRRPVDLCIDLDGDGTFQGVVTNDGGREMRSPERFNLSDPFRVDDVWYVARPTVSGAELTFTPTAPPGSDVAALQKPIEVRDLLEPGVVAPAFTVETPEGGRLSLADFRGTVVILDFWATWCGPCLSSMPGLEKLYQSVKDQGVEVLSVNVFDSRDSFATWVEANRGTNYNFTFAHDPTPKDAADNIARTRYNVPGLPTLYIIDREGRVAAAFVGAQEGKLIEALAKLGVNAEGGTGKGSGIAPEP